MELDKEEILNELMNFEKNYGRDCENGLPDYLERLLINIAKSGDTIYPWNKIKPVILKKIELVVNEFNTKYPYENNPVLPNVKPFNFQEMKDEIIEKFEYFNGAPFTIQRICELLTAPYKYYKRSDKFMRGLEKNIRVISTTEVRREEEFDFEAWAKEFPPYNNSSSPSSSASSSNILLSSSPLPSSSSSSSTSPLPSSSSAPSASSSSQISSIASSSSAFMNGLNEKEESSSRAVLCSNQMSQSCSHLQDSDPLPNAPAPLQQLDSFTTVFASPPSTPLAVVSDIHPYDAGSPSSSSSSSSESSPQPSSSSSPPPSLAPETHELNQDVELEDARSQENSNINKMGNLNGSVKPDDEQVNMLEQEEPMKQVENDKSYENSDEKSDVKQVEKFEENQNKNQDGDQNLKQNEKITTNQEEKHDEKQNEKQDDKQDEIQDEKQEEHEEQQEEKQGEKQGEKVENKLDEEQDDKRSDKQSDKHDEMQDETPEEMQDETPEEMQDETPEEMQEEMREEIQDKNKI